MITNIRLTTLTNVTKRTDHFSPSRDLTKSKYIKNTTLFLYRRIRECFFYRKICYKFLYCLWLTSYYAGVARMIYTDHVHVLHIDFPKISTNKGYIKHRGERHVCLWSRPHVVVTRRRYRPAFIGDVSSGMLTPRKKALTSGRRKFLIRKTFSKDLDRVLPLLQKEKIIDGKVRFVV